jgi:3-hydroxy-9,10-secoandrosta-1,3,5(10)-triene-9,17-dione monooxygenase reductase component
MVPTRLTANLLAEAVTAYGGDGPVGMSRDSLTSVSLEPPLVLLCAPSDGRTWPAIRQCGRHQGVG